MSREATSLIELMIWSAKDQTNIAKKAVGFKMANSDAILLAGITMAHNVTAVREVAKQLGISEVGIQ